MKAILVHNGLSCVLNAKIGEVTAEKDEKAMALIMLALKPAQLLQVHGCKTTQEIWEKLKEVYRPQGPGRKVFLFKKLMQMKIGDGEDMEKHIKDFSEVVHQLNEIAIDIPEEILSIILLSSLPNAYDNFVIAIEARDKLPSIETLKVKLLEEAQRRHSVVPGEQAYVVQHKGNQQYKKEVNSKAEEIKKKPTYGKCFNCGKPGHYAANCKKPKKKKEVNLVCALLASSTSKKTNPSKWCVDSGATSLMCNDRSIFIEIEDHDEDVIVAGGSMLKATAKGKVKVKTKENSFVLTNVLFVPDLQHNFLSISRAAKHGVEVNFSGKFAYVCAKEYGLLAKAEETDGLYVFCNVENQGSVRSRLE